MTPSRDPILSTSVLQRMDFVSVGNSNLNSTTAWITHSVQCIISRQTASTHHCVRPSAHPQIFVFPLDSRGPERNWIPPCTCNAKFSCSNATCLVQHLLSFHHPIMSIRDINPNAEIVSRTQARAVNVAAGVGLLNVLKSNLGPRGTLKLLVGGAGQLKLTKDGLVLLKEMQIQHPTAALIARTATAQDDVTGDGTTSTVLLCGELLRQSDRHVSEGLHPRILVEGLEQARDKALQFLTTVKVAFPSEEMIENRDLLVSIAMTSLNTKLDHDLSLSLSEALVSAMQCVYEGPEEPIDLSRVEILSIPRTSAYGEGTQFINGIVMDHGARHPDMPDILENCKIMTCNVSLEYEKTETQSGFFYSTAEEREKLVESERKWLDERCKLIIDFKRSVCKDGEVSQQPHNQIQNWNRKHTRYISFHYITFLTTFLHT